MTSQKRIKPKMGDALVVNFTFREGLHTTMAVADCECGEVTYTAVSHSLAAARAIIYRKHVKHLVKCRKQAELFLLNNPI